MNELKRQSYGSEVRQAQAARLLSSSPSIFTISFSLLTTLETYQSLIASPPVNKHPINNRNVTSNHFPIPGVVLDRGTESNEANVSPVTVFDEHEEKVKAEPEKKNDMEVKKDAQV